MNKMNPFVKWLGGKKRVVNKLLLFCQTVPFRRYFEPFLGGGALYLNLKPDKAILNDLNKELINTWKIIKVFPNQLIQKLEQLKKSYYKEKDYLFLRDKYNKFFELKDSLNQENSIEQAALFIFINKSCFNGLYRVNREGKFNVPWNKTINHRVYDKENLLNISKFLNTSESCFYNQDFQVILKKTQSQDLIYLDPPYDLLNKTTFTSYTEKRFDLESQKKLASLFQKLHDKGCYVMLSNHKTSNIWKLYQNRHFFIYHLPVKRLISSKKENRKTITEILITNFSVPGEIALLPHSLPYEDLKKLILKKQHYMALNPKWYSDLSDIKNQKILPNQKEITTLKELYKSSDIKKDLVVMIKNNRKIPELLSLIFATRWEKFQEKMIKVSASVEPEAFVDFLDRGQFLTVFSSQNITALDDYLWGVEVGMDTNARKNRSGKIMQDWVQTILENKSGLKIWDQKKVNDVFPLSGFPLNYQNWDQKLLKKQWDFILQTDNKFYFLECNYFDVAGSKIDTVAAQYGSFYEKMNSKKDLYLNSEFIWITDGAFWEKSTNIEKYQKYVPNLIFLKDLLDKKF